jgi:hypothetical protein
MIFKCGNKELSGANATIRMESGDHVSVAFTDLSGDTRVVTIRVQGKVMLVNDEKTEGSLLIRSAGCHFEQGQ